MDVGSDGLGRSRNEKTGAVHWNHVWSTKAPDEVSWTQPVPVRSLAWVDRVAPSPSDIVDVGGGASVLVDHLLERGHRPRVVDVAGAALGRGRGRLGVRADDVDWVVADVTAPLPEGRFDVWHDRAVFHFLTEPGQRSAYRANLVRSLRPGGHAIVAAFAPDGPEQCSGLPVCRYDADGLRRAFGAGFVLVDQAREMHVTPWGAEQAFQYVLMRRED